MKKAKLLAGTSLALVASLAIAGTAAYLTDTAENQNTMTYGKVTIAQKEYQRVQNDDGTYVTGTVDGQTSYMLEDFEQGKALLPIVGDPTLSASNPGYKGWDATTVRMSQVDSYGGMQVFAGKNAQDKFVTVTNTGNNDAYVRTLVAVECGTGDPGLIKLSNHQTWDDNAIGTITINGCNHYLYEFEYSGGQLSNGSWRHQGGLLPAGDTAYPSLSQVYVKSAATNEDMAKLDSNGDGLLNVLVFSQAVQADGFENAEAAFDASFGDVTVSNHPWSATP